jgi:hypothetical protein
VVASGSIARHPHLYLVLFLAIMMVHKYVIHDAGEKDVEGVVDDWVPDVVTCAPAASKEMRWHRYQDPESKQNWISCVSQPDQWCYESEVVLTSVKCDSAWFLFQGKWQQVANAPRAEATEATSTAALQPNPTEGSGRAACTRGGTSINECAEYGHPHPCPLSDR